MKWKIWRQLPKTAKKPMIGTLDCPKTDRRALVFDDNHRVIGELHGCRLVWISLDGIRLAGFEPKGFDKKGNLKFIYQEWFATGYNE